VHDDDDDDCDHEAVHQVLGTPRADADKLRDLDSVIEQFGRGEAVADRRLVARALYDKAKIFAVAKKHGESVAVCEEIRKRFSRDDDEDVQHWLGEMLAGVAVCYSALWLPDRARDAYREAVARFGDSPVARLRTFAPRALCDECVRARQARDVEASVAAAKEAARFASDEAPSARLWAARAMQAGGLTLERAGRAEAIRSYDEAHATFHADADDAVRAIAVSSSFDAARVVQIAGRRDEAVARYESLATKYATDDAAAVHVAKSMLNLGVLLGELGRPAQEIAAYDRIDARFGASRRADLAYWVAAALRNKAMVQKARGDRAGATKTLSALVERYASHRDATVVREVQRARADLVAVERR
jgi:tetratricopeptide (TPR) repeat protein